MGFDYYFSAMNRDEAAVYVALLDGITAFRDSVKVGTSLSYAEVFSVFRRLKMDRPELYYCSHISLMRGAGGCTAIPGYAIPKKDAARMTLSFCKKAKAIMNGADGENALECARIAHDWIIGSVTYTSLYRNFSHEIFGVFNNGIGVCEGIAKTVKFLLDSVGTDSLVVLSEPDGKGVAHAWNMVYVKGKPYHLDATFDLSGSEYGGKYRFFMLTDAEIAGTHRPSVYTLPKSE